jgi:hypothetical protein
MNKLGSPTIEFETPQCDFSRYKGKCPCLFLLPRISIGGIK